MDPAPYSQIAPVYDTLMGEVDYEGWADYISDLLSSRGIAPPARVLDLACGTGTVSLLLAGRGFKPTGLDMSTEMLEQARLKSESQGLAVDWRQGDMRRLRIEDKYAAAVCLFDSVNYLTEESELSDFFAAVRRSLQPGGMFIFDMNTVHALSCNWGNGTKVRQDGDVHSIWRSSYRPCDRTAVMELTVFQPDGSGGYRKLREVHAERGYEPEETESLLKRSGFREVKFYKHGTHEPPDEDTPRVMITAEA